MAWSTSVAHRAARRLRRAIPVAAAIALAAVAAATSPAAPARAAFAPKVVIVVGPSGGATSDYLGHARAYARQARAYGATVSEIYTPHATWSRVVAAAQGANIFIYLGHGNGWPSPYAPYQGLTKDGLGLNPRDGAGNTRVKYYGEDYLAAHVRFAPGAVVLLNRLCYASGAGEPGSANPSWATAIRRVDNYGSGFIDAGAAVVLADGHTSLDYELARLFGTNQRIVTMWRTDPKGNDNDRAFASRRSPGLHVWLDPDGSRSGFYRSLVGSTTATTAGIRIPAFAGAARTALIVRAAASTSAAALQTLANGGRFVVRGRVRADAHGRTWVPVMTPKGVAGWIAGWKAAYAGSARAVTRLVLRSSPSTHAGRRDVIAPGARLRITGSTHDTHRRAWLRVRTASGRTGWVAAWLTRP